MKILSIDTSVKTAAVSLAEADENTDTVSVLSEVYSSALPHSSALMPMIDHALKITRTLPDEIGLICTVTGPGSFTGIRIGVSAAKGLAFSDGESPEIPTIPLSSLEVSAYSFHGARIPADGKIYIIPAIDARRRQIYTAMFELLSDGTLTRIMPDNLVLADDFCAALTEKFSDCTAIFTGDGANLCYNIIEGRFQANNHINLIYPPYSAKNTAAFVMPYLGYKKYKSNRAVSPILLVPSYLIKTEAERNLEEQNISVRNEYK